MVRPCRDSIMQLDKSSDLSAVRQARLSGTSVKRLEDKSKDRNVAVTGRRLSALIVVKALSARLRYLRNLHFDIGRTLTVSRFEAVFTR